MTYPQSPRTVGISHAPVAMAITRKSRIFANGRVFLPATAREFLGRRGRSWRLFLFAESGFMSSGVHSSASASR